MADSVGDEFRSDLNRVVTDAVQIPAAHGLTGELTRDVAAVRGSDGDPAGREGSAAQTRANGEIPGRGQGLAEEQQLLSSVAVRARPGLWLEWVLVTWRHRPSPGTGAAL
ncbi:hypothetical protein ACWD3J_44525 [Streptomyces sp. NPDC002755]